MAKKVMKLLDPITGLMECKICGSRHWAMIPPGRNGKYSWKSWQCVKGCKFEDDKPTLN